MWLTRKQFELWSGSFTLLQQVVQRLDKSYDDLRAERDRLIESLKAWSTRGREAEAEVNRLRAKIASDTAMYVELHKRVASSEAREAIFRTEVNCLRLDHAALLARVIPGLDLKVPSIEAPLPGPQAVTDQGLNQFEDLGDERAAAVGYKEMHDIPPSKPATPD